MSGESADAVNLSVATRDVATGIVIRFMCTTVADLSPSVEVQRPFRNRCPKRGGRRWAHVGLRSDVGYLRASHGRGHFRCLEP